MVMVIIGFVIYVLITLKVSMLALMVWVWPGGLSHPRGEVIITSGLAALMWYGAYYFWPFNVQISMS